MGVSGPSPMTSKKIDTNPTPDAPRRRGRPPRISYEDILAAATSIPFDDVTIEAVAERLGVTRAAIYRYVGSSDELRAARATTSISTLDFSGELIDDWREWHRSYAKATREWLLVNIEFREYLPLSAEVIAAGNLLGPVEHGIELLIDAGFDERTAARSIRFLSGIVWNNAQDEMKARNSDTSHHPLADQLLRLPQESFADRPRTHRFISDGRGFDAESRFDREIAWAIAGLESELDS